MLGIVLLLIGIAEILLSIFVLKKGYQKITNLLFFLFALITGIWVISNYLIGVTENIFWLKMAYALGALIYSASFIWLLNFLYPNIKKAWFWFIFTIAIVFSTLSLTDELIIRKATKFYYGGFEGEFGILFTPYLIFAALMTFLNIWFVIRGTKINIGQKKQQLKYIAIGFVTFGIGASLASFVIPSLGFKEFIPLDSIFSLPLLLAISYAIIKYRFLDIRFILRKSFIYVGLAIFVFAAYYLALWIDNTFFGGSYSIGGYLSAIAIAPIFLLGFGYISRWIKHIANKYFFTGLYDYQQVLETFARKISQTIKLDEVVSLVMDTIQGAMRVDNMAVALSDSSNIKPFLLHKVIGFSKETLENICSHQHFCQHLQSIKKPIVIDELLSDHEKNKEDNLLADAKLLKDLGVALVLPFVIKGGINSLVVVGTKITKEAYTKEDIELLTTLSNQASVAIENARLYNNMEEMVESATAKLKKMLKTQSEFLDISSHQLRTPVSLIRGVFG